jgi:hypothetical protein
MHIKQRHFGMGVHILLPSVGSSTETKTRMPKKLNSKHVTQQAMIMKL